MQDIRENKDETEAKQILGARACAEKSIREKRETKIYQANFPPPPPPHESPLGASAPP